MDSTHPIVLLDSGLGGLTVARELRRALPAEDLLYFGDTARVPYGIKGPETVTFLRPSDHCSTFSPPAQARASSPATPPPPWPCPACARTFPELSISGVIEPGASAAVAAAGGQNFSRDRHPGHRGDHPLAGVRQGHPRPPQLGAAAGCAPPRCWFPSSRMDAPPMTPWCAWRSSNTSIRSSNAASTCWSWAAPTIRSIRDLIQRLMGNNVAVIDSASACAEDVRRRLALAGLLRADTQHGGSCAAS